MSRRLKSALVPLCAFVLVAVCGQAQSARKTMHATGTFVVAMGKADTTPIGQEAGLSRMTIDKTWSGAITGTSKGEMLSQASANGSMVYVALETMTVSVNGKSGTFVFRHSATMMAGDAASAELKVSVVPKSGTGELAGIAGDLSITIDTSGHSYDFAYTLAGQ